MADRALGGQKSWNSNGFTLEVKVLFDTFSSKSINQTGGRYGVHHQIYGEYSVPGLSDGAAGRAVRHHGAGGGGSPAAAGAPGGELL